MSREPAEAAAPATPAQLLDRLHKLGITVTTVEHPAAFTVAEGEQYAGHLPGMHIKNLFLRDAQERMWLVTAPWNRAIDLKKLPALIGSTRLSFGSPARLMRVLGVTPGSVTPFAIINDRSHQVQVVLDQDMMRQQIINAHPLINTMTTTIASADLSRFIAACGHRPQVIDLQRAAPQ